MLPERDVVRVRPTGELDLATAGALEAQVQELLDAGFRRLVLDLRALSFMDSTGLRAVLSVDARARREGIELGILQGPDAIRRVFAVCGLLDRLPFR